MRLIDADALIKTLETTSKFPIPVWLRAVIIDAPTIEPEPHWIPCSERYPDMDERVLVYTVAHEYHVWDCMSNRADNYFWEDEDGLYHDKYEADLWMPLPEPYAERRTDEQT